MVFQEYQCIELNFYNWKQQSDDSSNCRKIFEEIYRAVSPNQNVFYRLFRVFKFSIASIKLSVIEFFYYYYY